MTDQNRKILLGAGAIGLAILLWLTFSPWGAISNFRLKRELSEVTARNHELTEANRAMETEITRLRSDSTYLEKVARDQYGLLRKNEVVYKDKPKPKPEEEE